MKKYPLTIITSFDTLTHFSVLNYLENAINAILNEIMRFSTPFLKLFLE